MQLTFLVRDLSDFTEFPMATKQQMPKPKILLFYVFSLTVRLYLYVGTHTCMYVCMTCIGPGLIKKGTGFCGLLADIKGHLGRGTIGGRGEDQTGKTKDCAGQGRLKGKDAGQ